MSINRRQFMKQAGYGAGAALLWHMFPTLSWLPNLAYADGPVAGSASQDHFFVMLRTSGGLDATLGLDPQILAPGFDEKDMFVEYRPEEITEASGLRLGPAAKPLIPFADQCLIINGIMMRRDAGHSALNDYMVSGNGEGKAAALPIELAAVTTAGPAGVLTTQSLNMASRSVVLSNANAILTASDTVDPVPLLRELIGSGPVDDSALRRAAGAVVDSDTAIKRLAEILDGFRKREPGVTLTDKHVLVAAFASGASRQAQLDLVSRNNLDTHSNHPVAHLQAQTETWADVALLLKMFKEQEYKDGKSLLDVTTFMVISEFSRTPFLNAGKGKDHNPFTNSALLIGKGIQRGKVVGASRLIARGQRPSGESLHIGMPFNYAEGRVADTRDGASFIYPENVARTVAQIFGSPAEFASVERSVLPVPGVALT